MKTLDPKRLRELREHAGLSQTELANTLGVDKTVVSRWESGGRKPSIDQQFSLSRALGITLDYLLNAELAVHFQFRAKKTVQDKSPIERALVDAEMQIHYLDSAYRLAERLPQPFAIKMDFLQKQLPTIAQQMRTTLKLNQRVVMEEFKQALAELNVHVFEWALPSEVSGLSYRNAYAVIFVNRMHSRERQLFTLAHECAHLLFHLGRDNKKTMVSVIASNREPEEKEANAFAAELLMPLETLEQRVKVAGARIKSLETLDLIARYFNVSRDAVFYRLAEREILGWEEKKQYFSQRSSPPAISDVRVKEIDKEISPEFFRMALELYDAEKISAGKLTDWFFTSRDAVDDYIARRSKEAEEATIF